METPDVHCARSGVVAIAYQVVGEGATDLVGSTERAAELGDKAWRDLLAGHQVKPRAGDEVLAEHGGHELKGVPGAWRLYAVAG